MRGLPLQITARSSVHAASARINQEDIEPSPFMRQTKELAEGIVWDSFPGLAPPAPPYARRGVDDLFMQANSVVRCRHEIPKAEDRGRERIGTGHRRSLYRAP